MNTLLYYPLKKEVFIFSNERKNISLAGCYPPCGWIATGCFYMVMLTQGKRYAGTGLYYYGARYYDSRSSVWLSTDPLQEKYPNVSTYAYTNITQ